MYFPEIECEIIRHGLSKEEFCRKMGVSTKTYNNWQRKGNIPSRKLELMSDEFKCSVDYLLGIKKSS